MPEYRVLNENMGRKTHGNPVSLPSGSAITCENFETLRPNVYRKVRGRNIYGTTASTGNIEQLLAYNNRLFVHYSDDTIYYDSDGAGAFTDITGTYIEPFTGFKIKELEFNSNMYFTTSEGVQKIDTLGQPGKKAGVSKALGMDLRIVDDVNWLTTLYTVAYRGVWSYTDANNNLIIGSPSDRCEITNQAGVDRAVELNVQVIPEATTLYTFSLYRSSQVSGTPPEDFQLVYKNTPTASEIATGSMIITDVMPDDFRDAALYTNTNFEGISQSNYQPPRAASLDKYREYTFYANIENLHRLYTNLISTSGLTVGTSKIYLYDTTYTPVAVTNAVNNGVGLTRLTAATHGLQTDDYIYVKGVTGTVEANGSWKVTRINANTIDLQGSTFVNAFVGAGTLNKTLELMCQRYDTNVGGAGIGAAGGTLSSADNGGGKTRITTDFDHNLITGDYIRISGAVAGSNANGCWLVTNVGATTFDILALAWSGTSVGANGVIDMVTNRGDGITAIADNGSGMCRFATSKIHGLSVNDFVNLYDVTGTPLANGIHRVTFVSDTTHFDIDIAFVANGTGMCDLYERVAGDKGNSLKFFKHTTGTDAQNIDMTARSIVRCINRAENNDFLDAFYISGVSDPVGRMQFASRSLGLEYFYMNADTTTTGGSFTPVIPVTGTDYKSTNDRFPHAMMYSKSNQPEAVPLVNIDYIGNKNDPILAVIGLKDSLFIVKQKDGIYRLTGNTPASFIITAFDTTVQCLSRNSIAKGENAFFMYSNLGYIRVSDSGVELIGNDNLFKDLTPSQNANIESAYGYFYENEHTYFCSNHEDPSDTDNTVVNAYNTVTQAWYQVRGGIYTNDPCIRAGKLVNNILYTAGLTSPLVYKERKNFAVTDYASPDIACTILAIDAVNNIVTLSVPISVPIESVLVQGIFKKTITDIITPTEIEVSNVNNLLIAAAIVRPGIESILEYQQNHCGTPEYVKLYRKTHVFFDSDETNIKNILAETMTDSDKNWKQILFSGIPGNYWGKKWGTVWGLSRLIDRWLFEPLREHQLGSIQWLRVTHRVAEEQCAICGYSTIYDPTSERTRY